MYNSNITFTNDIIVQNAIEKAAIVPTIMTLLCHNMTVSGACPVMANNDMHSHVVKSLMTMVSIVNNIG